LDTSVVLPATVSRPTNEPAYDYAPGSPERAALKARLAATASDCVEIPLVIGGTAVASAQRRPVAMPHDHRAVIGEWHVADGRQVQAAIDAALAAHHDWSRWPLEERAAIFLRAADLLSTSWRPVLNAATMLGQSKTVVQAEIDAATELIDFFRFNAFFASQVSEDQPISTSAARNETDYRPLEGFVYAVTPFNFTSIAGNLPTAPALMGNTVVWKPAATAMLSAHYIMALLEAAGLPPGVMNFVPGDPQTITNAVLASRDLAGIHFTGSTAVFNTMWRTVSDGLETYRAYPRLVGETGGKDFIVAHPSADPAALAVAIIRGGFEYQGQKCSAPSRLYIPRSLWPNLRERLADTMSGLQVGDVADFRTFMGAVIDRKAFTRIAGYLDEARRSARIVQGGDADDTHGYFVSPTLVETDDPRHRLMTEEIFGPVVTVYVYPDAEWDETLDLVDGTSPYALTGAVFARERQAIDAARLRLRHAAGNFYVNDKPTGAVVGQQPFGGARASGTNDKAGSKLNLIRWTSPRAIKETADPPVDYTYPSMRER
jgi:1-pyrroline-5-carboxylate dehydrogenase